MRILSVHVGGGAVDYIDPPSGSVVTNFKGTGNAITITCNITSRIGVQITTQWFLENFGNSAPGMLVSIANAPAGLFEIDGDPRPDFPGERYDNRLTVLNLTSALD